MYMSEPMQAVHKRLLALLWERHDPSAVLPADPLAELIPGETPDTLCFPDIDYADQCRHGWDAARHYNRLLKVIDTMGRGSLADNAVYRDKLARALRYWIRHDFINPNWWHNQIGMPMIMGEIALMTQDYLPEDVLEGITNLVSRGSLGGENRTAIEKWTGANLIWGVTGTLYHALLTGDEDLLTCAVTFAARELVCTNYEGIQPDGSFFQHGPRLYSGGYGDAFADDISRLAYLLQETPWQFTEEQLTVFTRHILKGLRYMTKNSTYDYACVGRNIARAGIPHASGLADTVRQMLQTAEMPRKDELADFLAELEGTKVFTGTRYFQNAAMLCHHTGGLYVGAKFLTKRLIGAEICNGEGVLCANMAYGTHTCAMTDGTEYVSINPLWDFSKIPGTTAAFETDEQLYARREWLNKLLPSDVAGGCQSGDYALIYELAEHCGIRTLCADFAFPGGFICLGTDISTEVPQLLRTTVEQSHRQGELAASDTEIRHHGIRYTALDGSRFAWSSEEVTGAWKRNSETASPAPVTGEILTITIDHPADTVSGGSTGKYAYMLSPAASDAPEVTVLRNDSQIQAIRLHDGTVMAVFYETTSLYCDGKIIRQAPGGYIG